MRWTQAGLKYTGAAAIAAVLAACSSGSSSTGPKYQAITAADTTEVASFANEGISTVLGGLTNGALATDPSSLESGGLLDFQRDVGPSGPSGPHNLAAIERAAMGKVVHTRDDGTCPTTTVNSNDTVYTFGGAACTSSSDGETVSITGSITISDLTLSEGEVGYNIAFNNLTINEAGTDGTLNLSENGTRVLNGNSSGLSLVDNWTFSLTSQADTSTLKLAITDGLSVSFTATTSGSIDFYEGTLPAGTFTISGTFAAAASLDSYSYAFAMTFTTVTPLSYDPSCYDSDHNENAIVGGELRVAATGGTVDIVYHACGTAPSYTFTAS